MVGVAEKQKKGEKMSERIATEILSEMRNPKIKENKFGKFSEEEIKLIADNPDKVRSITRKSEEKRMRAERKELRRIQRRNRRRGIVSGEVQDVTRQEVEDRVNQLSPFVSSDEVAFSPVATALIIAFLKQIVLPKLAPKILPILKRLDILNIFRGS